MSTGLSKYYKLFGLPETATQAEIKQKYRQLAMRHHPDKNGGDDRLFLEIKEAYEYLTGRKTVAPSSQTYTHSPSRSTSQARQQPNEERVKQAQQRQKDQAYKEHIENERFFQKLTSGVRWNLMKLSAVIGTVIVFILLLELFLPHRYETKRVTAYDLHTIGGLEADTRVKRFIMDDGKSYYSEDILAIYSNDPDVILVKSNIFHNEFGFIPIYGYDQMLEIQYDIGAHAYVLIPVFIFPFFIVLFKRKTHSFTLFYYVSLYLSVPLIGIFLFTNDRWAHLLTLGFI